MWRLTFTEVCKISQLPKGIKLVLNKKVTFNWCHLPQLMFPLPQGYPATYCCTGRPEACQRWACLANWHISASQGLQLLGQPFHMPSQRRRTSPRGTISWRDNIPPYAPGMLGWFSPKIPWDCENSCQTSSQTDWSWWNRDHQQTLWEAQQSVDEWQQCPFYIYI